MLDFIATRGPELILTVLGALVAAYLRRNRQDVDRAHADIAKLKQAHHDHELKLAQDYPTAEDVGAQVRAALEPMTTRLQSGDNRMQRIEGSLDKLVDRLDRVLVGDRLEGGSARR